MKLKTTFGLMGATMLILVGNTSVYAAPKEINSNTTKTIVIESNSISSIEEWKTKSTYSVGDKVTYNGKIYECTVAHSKLKPTTTYVWKCLGEVNPQWQPNTTYSVGDKVTYTGKTYECSVAHSKLKPTIAYVWKCLG